MPSPFPGMDPYLESRSIWPDVHHRLITAMGDALSPQVAPAYYVGIEEHAYIVRLDHEELVGRPDIAIVTASNPPAGGPVSAAAVAEAVRTVILPAFERRKEGYLEIRDTQTHDVVTVIELLSPSNKMRGEGRKEYENKRLQVLSSLTNLIEIDLLRAGVPMEMEPQPGTDYHVLVRAGWERSRAKLYVFSVRDSLPNIPVPLRSGEKEAALNLGKLLSEIYDRAHYRIRINYSLPPDLPLSPQEARWAEELLRSKGLV